MAKTGGLSLGPAANSLTPVSRETSSQQDDGATTVITSEAKQSIEQRKLEQWIASSRCSSP
jgi:hypothetical protein